MTDMLEVLSTVVATARAYMATPEATAMRAQDFALFRDDMMRKFPTLSNSYPYLFEKIIKNDNVDMLDNFIGALREVQTGAVTFENARDRMGQLLNGMYMPKHLTP